MSIRRISWAEAEVMAPRCSASWDTTGLTALAVFLGMASGNGWHLARDAMLVVARRGRRQVVFKFDEMTGLWCQTYVLCPATPAEQSTWWPIAGIVWFRETWAREMGERNEEAQARKMSLMQRLAAGR